MRLTERLFRLVGDGDPLLRGGDRASRKSGRATAECVRLGLSRDQRLGDRRALAPPDRERECRQTYKGYDDQRYLAERHDHHAGQEQSHEVHDLDKWVESRSGSVLEWISDGVANDARLVRLASLPAVHAVLDELFGVVPNAARVGQQYRHELSGKNRSGKEPAKRLSSRKVVHLAVDFCSRLSDREAEGHRKR